MKPLASITDYEYSESRFQGLYYDQMEAALREEILGRVLEAISEGVYFMGADGRISYWNKGAERITGYSSGDTISRSCSENLLRHVDTSGCELCVAGCPLALTMADGVPREADAYLHHKDGHRVPVSVRALPVAGPDGKTQGTIAIFSDRSERSSLVAELEQLRKETLTDALTGLGNRRYAELCASAALKGLEAGRAGIIMVDIDRFKDVNDNHGHATGDRVLRMVAWTLANAVRRMDAAARWGGEEFLVVCPLSDERTLLEVAERIRVLVERSWISLEDGRRLSVTVSVGGAVARKEESFEALVERADARLYACKEGGRNRASVES
jgi:diguanylate cyclase (GGDEF)-like protein/PAS domain S-box-containing protein